MPSSEASRTEMTRASLEAREPKCVLVECKPLALGEAAEAVTPRFLEGPGREGGRPDLCRAGEALTGWQCRGLQGGREAPSWSSGESGSSRHCPTLEWRPCGP